MNATLRSWQRLWQEAGGTADEQLFQRLIAAYSEPHRHYHTLQHLRECFERFDEARETARRPAEIGLALWFHDAIYDVHRHDNEQLSADWARDCALAGGLGTDAASRVHALVMATRHDAPATGHDEQLLVDVDLAILGAAPPRFDEYETQVRSEYAHVPQAGFRSRRKAILQAVLARPRLYATPVFYAACEQQARDNLRRSIERL